MRQLSGKDRFCFKSPELAVLMHSVPAKVAMGEEHFTGIANNRDAECRIGSEEHHLAFDLNKLVVVRNAATSSLEFKQKWELGFGSVARCAADLKE